MKITFLGTGTSQGIPIIGSDHPVCLSNDPKDKRLRVSVLVEWDAFTYVVDCGPDFRYQMLRAGVKRIDGIVFTHEHSDHVLGLDDIRPFYFRQGNIPLYAHKRVLKSIKRRFDYFFAKENRYPGAPEVITHRIKNKPFKLKNLEVVPIKGKHFNLQVFGFKFNDFAYLTDMKTVSDKEIEKIKNVKVLVINALRIKPHQSHFNLEEALEFIEKVNPETAYLTHISHLLGFHKEVEESLPEHVFLAYDGLKITV
ncbi:MBL fold metallo-hydrolase [Algibacter luteus]|uniref:Phosphoribosyl 1,2-cyclic phosphate phosphodiesterase n=1 Tax=Algibacter luteus TaxID=1178825 RepID=A0A1M6BK11_9FLAO|nr:MBL fold metallo-hydrolase [Algibacter luteus]SHI48938.1 phosphoribosyl 1,2-cyclic phosphate phosphodiesterase [Algibacter luteus]